jgi:hypothetical protein
MSLFYQFMPDNPAVSRLAGSFGPMAGNNTHKKGSLRTFLARRSAGSLSEFSLHYNLLFFNNSGIKNQGSLRE